MSLSLKKRRKYKLIFWGIGVTSSYNNKFDSNQKWDKVRFYFARKADAIIFYTTYPIERFLTNGFKPEKLFVAHNTVSVSAIDIDHNNNSLKKDFLFIGTLYEQKGVKILINAYLELFDTLTNVPKLHIIGGGPLESELREMIVNKNMNEYIHLYGPIYDKDKLKYFFQRSIVCISPNQAGLSILASMGSGVPYLTNVDAYTGGEIFNIKDKVTGLLYKGGEKELTQILRWIINNRNEMINIGRNAYEFYSSFRRPEHMASSISEAINYVLIQT